MDGAAYWWRGPITAGKARVYRLKLKVLPTANATALHFEPFSFQLFDDTSIYCVQTLADPITVRRKEANGVVLRGTRGVMADVLWCLTRCARTYVRIFNLQVKLLRK